MRDLNPEKDYREGVKLFFKLKIPLNFLRVVAVFYFIIIFIHTTWQGSADTSHFLTMFFNAMNYLIEKHPVLLFAFGFYPIFIYSILVGFESALKTRYIRTYDTYLESSGNAVGFNAMSFVVFFVSALGVSGKVGNPFSIFAGPAGILWFIASAVILFTLARFFLVRIFEHEYEGFWIAEEVADKKKRNLEKLALRKVKLQHSYVKAQNVAKRLAKGMSDDIKSRVEEALCVENLGGIHFVDDALKLLAKIYHSGETQRDYEAFLQLYHRYDVTPKPIQKVEQ